MSKKSRPKKTNNPTRILILAAVLVLAAVVLLLKEGSNGQGEGNADAGDLPAVQLQAALTEHRPTLAFFHSTTCDQCIEMTGIVAEVYPEYEGSVALVDVNVYDERNAALLDEMRIQFIPTLILFDRSGDGRIAVGVMEAAVLREALAALVEGS